MTFYRNLLCVFLAVVLGSVSVHAATWTWVPSAPPPTIQNWNTAARWSPASLPSSAVTTVLNFSAGGDYISNNDISNNFTVNQINFSGLVGPQGVGTQIIGNSIRFGQNGATLPTINNTGSFAVFGNSLAMAADMTATTTGSVGVTVFSGGVQGAGRTLTLLGSGQSLFNSSAVSLGTLVIGNNTTSHLVDINTPFSLTSVAVRLATGTLRFGVGTYQFGTLTLTGNSTITLGPTSSTVRFAASNAASWTAGQYLSITNWQGSLTGGGSDQVFFGASSGGLTAAQLGQIVFINPTGSGFNFYARILANGEIVPLLPEPSTWLAGAGLVAAAILNEIRRRKRLDNPLI